MITLLFVNRLMIGDVFLAVDVLLKPTGDAPIMKKRKWTVERTKKISSVIDFVRKYLKFEPQESLVSSNSLLSWKQTLYVCFVICLSSVFSSLCFGDFEHCFSWHREKILSTSEISEGSLAHLV